MSIKDVNGKVISVGDEVKVVARIRDAKNKREDLIGRKGIVEEITARGRVKVKTEAVIGEDPYNTPGNFKPLELEVI